MTNTPTPTAGDLVTVPRSILEPFSDLAGVLFARNFNAADQVVAIWDDAKPLNLIAGEFFALRQALTASPALPAQSGAGMREAIRSLDTHIEASAHYDGPVNGISRKQLQEWRAALSSPAPEGEAAQGVEPNVVRLWWFLHVLNACGKYGTYANDEPGEWVAAFCGDLEPKDTFNRACDLKLALCTHNSMDDTSRVWITEAGKAWLASRLTRQEDETRRAALEEARLAGAKAMIDQLVEAAITASWSAGTAQLEIAGLMVSVLAEHPELTARFMSEGCELFVEGHMDAGNGCLTFYSQKGEITTPQELRTAKTVKAMETSARALSQKGDEADG